MAIITKGITGGIRGKIGQIMGYTRNGQEIIQGVPKVSNYEKNRYNLNKGAILTELEFIWSELAQVAKDTWIAQTPPHTTAHDFFIDFNMGIFDLSYAKNLNGGYVTYAPVANFMKSRVSYDEINQIATITVPKDFTFPGNVLPTTVLFQAYELGNAVGTGIALPWLVSKTSYSQDISSLISASFLTLRILAFETPTTFQTQGSMLDLEGFRT